MEKALIIDGHGLAFRAFYALPPLNAIDGTPTNAVLGFINMLAKVETDMAPSLCVIVFDAPGPTFRHKIFPEYKAQRKPTPEEFKPQVPILQELLNALGYPVLSQEGVEADDVIASLALRLAEEEKEPVIVSSDKDLLQILGGKVTMLRPLKGISTLKHYDENSFKEEYGFAPASMPDYLALLGDSADNVPGVHGIGEKTAMQLIGASPKLEALFGNLNELKPAVRKKLEAGRETAFKSRDLIFLKTDVPVDLRSLHRDPPNIEKLQALCQKLNFSKLMSKFSHLLPAAPTFDSMQHEVASLPELPEPRPVNFSDISDSDEFAVFLSAGKGYPQDPALVEIQLAVRDGRYCILHGIEMEPYFWQRLRGKKLLVNDYKDLAACFGAETLIASTIWDLKTAHYLLHPDQPPHTLQDVLEVPHNCPEALLLFNAAEKLNFDMANYQDLSSLMKDVDLPLIPVLVKMEKEGIRLSSSTFAELQKELAARVEEIEHDITNTSGEEINLNSPKQVAWLLFERLGLPSGGKTKGKTGLSTSASVLESLANLNLPGSEIPRLMLEHRELSKMLSGFVIPLQRSAQLGGNIIHTTFESAFTGTGRLSSRDPNLQNLPAFGQWSRRIKEGLVPNGEDNIFVAADYSQIELRILAHLSDDEKLIAAFRDGRDIHRETASWVFSLEPEEVTPELRRTAKMINFGLIYGMSSFGLAERLGVSRGEASSIVDRYFQALPGVKRYLNDSAEAAKERGYTRTLFGRIRPIAEASRGVRDKNGLKRIAINSPIQGTAADIARKAMINFHRRFQNDVEVRLFLQIHDSLVCECPRSRTDEVGAALMEVMSSAARLSIPLEVELKHGSSLADV